MPSNRQRRQKAEKHFRTLPVELVRSDDAKREVELSFSSEAPVDRPGVGMEILSHSEGAADFSRLNAESAVLYDHSKERVLGRVVRAWVDGRRGRAIVRFGRTPFASEVFQNIKDGILRGVSFGYQILEYVENPGGIFATKWLPYEISITPTPFDVSVGIGRSFSHTNTARRQIDMSTTHEIEELRKSKKMLEAREALDHLRGRGMDIPSDTLALAERKGWGKNEVVSHVFDSQSTPTRGADTDILDDLHRQRGRHNEFNLVRAISRLASSKPLDGAEAEISAELEKRTGITPKGVLIPTSLFHQRGAEGRRSMFAGDFESAGALVPVDTGQTIEKLDARPTVERAGALVLRGLSGTVVLPRQIEGAVAQWLSESGAVDSSKLKFDDLTLTPHRLSTMSVYSKQLLVQTSGDIEMMVRRDLALRIALGLDFAALAGAGTGGEPRGIFQLDTATSGVGTVTFGAAPSWQKITEFEAGLSGSNALRGNPAFVVSPAVAAVWKATSKDGGSGRFLMEGGRTNDYETHLTTQLAATDFADRALFGNFGDLVIGQWGALDIVIDQFSLADSGRVRVVVTQLADIGIRHPESFVVSTDDANQS